MKKQRSLASLADRAYSKNIELSQSRFFRHLGLWVIVDQNPKGFLEIYFEQNKRYLHHPGQLSDALWGFFPHWKDGIGKLSPRQLQTLLGVLDGITTSKAQCSSAGMGQEVSDSQEATLFETF